MICDTFGREGAEEVIDPFLYELHDKIVYMWFCEDCLDERRAEI